MTPETGHFDNPSHPDVQPPASTHPAGIAADRIEVRAWRWPEITSGTDLAALVAALPDLLDGDVVALTSKVVSKAEGRFSEGARADAVRRETARVVARRGRVVIAQTRGGLVMAAAGVDVSNVALDQVLLLPLDADESARRIRTSVCAATGRNVAVVITDTAGRAWREGQTDLAVGVAGLPPLVDLAGTLDTYGNRLSVTAPAVADEVAAAADLVKAKASRRPVAVVRGLAHLVLPSGVDGPGAAGLVRPAADDLFGLGAREAVTSAVRRHDPEALEHFTGWTPSDPAPFDGLSPRSSRVSVEVRALDAESTGVSDGWDVLIGVHVEAEPSDWVQLGRVVEQVETLAAAHRLQANPQLCDETVLPAAGGNAADVGWRCWTHTVWTVA